MNPGKSSRGRRAISEKNGTPQDGRSNPSAPQVAVREEPPIDLAEQSFSSPSHSSPDTGVVTSGSFLRRGYRCDIPHRYPWFRDSVLGHLRTELSLGQMVSLSCAQVRLSCGSLEILGKHISERNTVESFEAFLQLRNELGKVYPHLISDASAPLFAARDGGPLLVSHRPLGLREHGFGRFVELRDQLAEFLFRSRVEWTLQQVSSVSIKDFNQYLKNNIKDPGQRTMLQELCREYEQAKAAWVSEIIALLAIVRGHSSKNKNSPLIQEITRLEQLSGSAVLAPEEKQRLCELRVIRLGLEEEEREWRRMDLINRAQQVAGRRLRVDESGKILPMEYPDEEPPKPSIVQMYVPNSALLFIGTDGGSMVGDG